MAACTVRRAARAVSDALRVTSFVTDAPIRPPICVAEALSREVERAPPRAEADDGADDRRTRGSRARPRSDGSESFGMRTPRSLFGPSVVTNARARRGASTSRNNAKPRMTSPAPMRTSHATPGPGPVKARPLDEAVTGCAVLPPPPPELEEGGAVVVVACDAAVVVVEPPVVVVEPVGALVVVEPEAGVVVVDAGVVVVVDDGAVVVVDDGVVVVVVVEPPAVAITGVIAEAVGAVVVMPPGVIMSFGYAVQVRSSGAPATTSDSEMFESCAMLIELLDAVNGPSVTGVAGTMSWTPLAGTGLGIVTLKLSVPVGRVAGVAPVASIVPEAVPDRVGEMLDAAEASDCGIVTVTW